MCRQYQTSKNGMSCCLLEVNKCMVAYYVQSAVLHYILLCTVTILLNGSVGWQQFNGLWLVGIELHACFV